MNGSGGSSVLYRPARRPLRIFAYDPVLGRVKGNQITIDVANERLERGPRGRKIEVIDFDSTNNTYYPPVDLDERDILMSAGISPAESDPMFHQQMVYAVCMKVIENAERALGREIRFRGGPLKVFPHAFRGANAFYDHDSRSLFFGYFRANEARPGKNLPSQWVFTCLSHDIVAHETTHAIVDKIRFRYRYPTNRDVLAFHEAIADIVAIFQHFTFPEILREAIRTTRADIRSPSPLMDLAVQFGHGTGKGGALRNALGDPDPDPSNYQRTFAPHKLGSILVAAVFDGFFSLYQSRIADLLRLATGGTGVLPEGALHPDLVNRAAAEAAAASDEILTACLRAFDYMPVLDVDFGDFLRALVTADCELNPDDRNGRRAALIEAFRRRGIHPSGVTSLGEEALLWDADLTVEAGLPALPEDVRNLVVPELVAYDRRTELPPEDWGDSPSEELGTSDEHRKAVYDGLYRFGRDHAQRLFLEGNAISVSGFNPTFRIGQDGKLRTEIVVQWVDEVSEGADAFGGLKPTAGTTVVFSADGDPRYIVPKPWPHHGLLNKLAEGAARRRDRMIRFVDECDDRDPAAAWASDDDWKRRMAGRFSFASLHSAPEYHS